PNERYQTADEMLADLERVLRTQYNSAGQTELKAWLAELVKRDGVLPMGRRVAALAAAPGAAGANGGDDLSVGASVELSDVGVGDTGDGPTLASVQASFELAAS